MKKLLCIGLVLGLLFSLVACDKWHTPTIPTDMTTHYPPVTEEPTTLPPVTEEATTAPTTLPPEPTEPEHSEFYIPGVSTEDIITYFNEVVLSMEYTTGDGDVTLVQKWKRPIRYRIEGTPTEEDMAVLQALFAQLNAIEGFPGLEDAQQTPPEDLTISFLDMESFNLAFSDIVHGEIADGAVQFWYYTDTNEIHTGRIGYRTDISQQIRNSVILEEIINCLGFNDTVMREDSIVYQYSSDNTQPSPIDWVLLRLMYHPDIQCGMNAQQCRAVLEKLYY